ncbi:MAG: lipopolysaccharide biosynthesis protein [Akkermansia sp.]|nr:lipopolysaccharide biosynthesis protein [Akkermansia sp.]
MASVREETVRGIKWGLIQKCTMQPVQFLFGIILARLISPDEMGILGLTSIFFAFAGQLQECGFGTALIRKQDRTDEDICTVFWFNVAMSFIFSLALFLAAPWFVWFFDQPALLNLTRVSALLMFLGSTGSVHWTLYNARRDFKTPAIVSMCTTLVAMPFTIWAAYAGWSYWAPMLQGIITGLLGLITVWIISPWKPKFKFSKESFNEFFKFGVNLTLSGIINKTYTEVRIFIIGKFYSPTQLAYFSRGEQTCRLPLSLADSVLGPILFPILATLQHDKNRLSSVYRRYISLSALVVEWGMITMAANANALILTLYGEKWATAAVYAQILCLGWMFNPLLSINCSMFAVLGRTDIMLKFETVLRVFSITAMIFAAFVSVKALCWAAVLSAIFAIIVSSFLVTKISELTIIQLCKAFIPYLGMSIIANIPSIFIDSLTFVPACRLSIGIVSSLVIYCLLLWFKRDSSAGILISLAKEKFLRKSHA